jgi:hypothetical protein
MPGNPTVTLNHSYVRERATRIREAAKRTAEGYCGDRLLR